MVTYRELVLEVFPGIVRTYLDARDMPADSDLSSFKYNELLQRMRTSPRAHEDESVLRLYEVSSYSEINLAVRKKRETNYTEQCFRVYLAFRQGFPGDQRTWDYAKLIPEKYTRPSAWQTSFFVSQKARSTGKDGFLTQVATPFERMLFSMAIKKVLAAAEDTSKTTAKQSGSDTRARKRARVTSVGKMDRNSAQRIGFAVQYIVRAWNVFARAINFTSVDAMISPYLCFNTDTFLFEVISKRAGGFAPVEQSTHLKKNLLPTLDADKICPTASSRSDETDWELRRLSKLFLQDVFSTVSKEELFSTTPADGETPQVVQHFELTGSSELPSRFEDFDENLLERLRGTGASEHDPAAISPVKFPSTAQPDPLKGLGKRRRVSTASGGDSRSASASASASASERHTIRPSRRQQPERMQAAAVCEGGTKCKCHQAREFLAEHMAQYVRMYDVSFRELLDTDEMLSSARVEEEVQLVLMDPPFNHRRESNRPNSDHDVLEPADIKDAVELMNVVKRPGGHGIIFTAPLQFHLWHEQISKVADSSGEPLFNIDPHPMAMVNKPGHYFGRVQKKTTALFPVCSWALHCTKVGLSNAESFDLVDYASQGHIASRHSAWTNVIDEVGRLRPGEQLRARGTSGSIRMVRPEQKSRELLKEIIARFTRPGDLVADFFAGTFSTAAACITLPKHRKFIGCEVRDEVFEIAKAKLIEIFAGAILDKYSDVVPESPEVTEAARLVVSHSMYEERAEPEWTPPEGFLAFQVLPSFLLRYLSQYWGVPGFPTEYRGKSVSKWPRSMRGALQSTPLDQMVAAEAASVGVCVGPSTIKHVSAGEGVFATKPFKKKDTIGYYYGALVYEDIGGRSEVTKTYGEDGTLGVTVREFNLFQMEVPLHPGGIRVGREVVKTAYVVPKFCCLRKMNDPRYRDGDEDKLRVEAGELAPRQANVQVVASTAKSLKDLINYKMLRVVAVKDIGAGEELFVDYGDRYFV